MAGERIDLAVEAAYPTSTRVLQGEAAAPVQSPGTRPANDDHRPFIGLEFACCKTYSRVYANAEHTAFVGRCPRCAKPVQIRISPDGQPGQFFRMS